MSNDRAVVSMHPTGEEDKMKMARTYTVAFRTHCCARRTLHEVQQRFYKAPDVEMQTEPSSSRLKQDTRLLLLLLKLLMLLL